MKKTVFINYLNEFKLQQFCFFGMQNCINEFIVNLKIKNLYIHFEITNVLII